MKENLIHYRTSVCNVNYHMVWFVKYRRKILNAEIENYLKGIVQQIAADKGFTVHLFEVGECDHVHCFVSAPPKAFHHGYRQKSLGREYLSQMEELRIDREEIEKISLLGDITSGEIRELDRKLTEFY